MISLDRIPNLKIQLHPNTINTNHVKRFSFRIINPKTLYYNFPKIFVFFKDFGLKSYATEKLQFVFLLRLFGCNILTVLKSAFRTVIIYHCEL